MAGGARKILIAAAECEPFTDVGHIGRVTSNLSAALLDGADVRVVMPMYGCIPGAEVSKAAIACEFESSIGRRLYKCQARLAHWRGVPIYLLSVNDYFAGGSIYTNVHDDIERFSCFCDAVIEFAPRVGFEPDVVQCHDWPMSYVPILHKARQDAVATRRSFSTLFVLHSMQYQGMCSRYDMHDLLDLSSDYFTPSALENYGQANSLKGGIIFSERIATVSESFAAEIQHSYYSENLEGVVRTRATDITGIMCGIDGEFFDPASDPTLSRRYSVADAVTGKRANKLLLQEAVGLPRDALAPVVLIPAGADDSDKGLELIKFVFDDMLAIGVQFLFVSKDGTADGYDYFEAAAREHPSQVACVAAQPRRVELHLDENGCGPAPADGRSVGGSSGSGGVGAGSVGSSGGVGVSASNSGNVDSGSGVGSVGAYLEDAAASLSETQCYAGADILLRPSRIEPCGEKHLIAMRYGAVPVVRETGGLKDVVAQCSSSGDSSVDEGNGFSFYNYNAHDMLYALERALATYRDDPAGWERLVGRAMSSGVPWSSTADGYRRIYDSMCR